LIVRRGGNQAGGFLEAVAFEMGGQKGFIMIPEGRRGWGWLKFSDELRKARDYLFAKAGCGSRSSLASVKIVGKEEEVRPGLAPLWKGPSFVEVLRSGSVSAMKEPIVGGRHSGWRASPEEQCALDLLPMVRYAEVEPRSVVDCFSLESPPLELLGKDRHFCLKGKKVLSHWNLNFENSKSEYSRMCTWNKLGSGFYVALGRAVRKLLYWFFGLGMGRKHLGFRVARFWLKLKLPVRPDPCQR
jgi:hypothetical protein